MKKNRDLEKEFVTHIPKKIPALVAIYNIQTGQYIYINEAIKQFLGYTPTEFLAGGVDFAIGLLHPDDFSSLMSQNAAAVKKANDTRFLEEMNKSVVTFEYRMKHKDGHYVWFRTDGVVFDRDKKGKVLHVMNVSLDISKRKEAELIADQFMQIRLAQETVITELGISALSGKPLKEILREAAQTVHDMLQVDYVSILEYFPFEKHMVLRAGVGWRDDVKVDTTHVPAGYKSHAGFTLHAQKPVVITEIHKEKRFFISSPLKNHEATSGVSCVIYGKDRPYGVLGAHTKAFRKFTNDDINFMQSIANLIALTVERKKLEEQKDEFIGIASHELKTPVTSIKAYIQLLSKQFKEAKDEKSYLMISKVEGQVGKLIHLISALLDATKIDAGKMSFTQNYFDFNELVEEIIEEMQRTISTHKIVPELSHSKTMQGDRQRIGQVITNFISNAIKYSPKADTIIIRSGAKNGKITFSVQDFGIGIEKDKQQDLFKRFYRVNSPYERSFPGLGLGLYISHEIITRHGGNIQVVSKKGKGSTFSFTIPVQASEVKQFPIAVQ